MELSSYVLSTLSDFHRDVAESFAEMTSLVQLTIQELTELMSSLAARTTYETMVYNLKLNIHQIYRQLIVVPRNNQFYIPLVLHSLRQLKQSMYTWNGSHILAGIFGFCVGSCVTLILDHYLFPQIKYLTLMKAIVAKSGRGLQGISYLEEASIPVTLHPNEVLVHVRAASLDPVDLEVLSERGQVLRELFLNKTQIKKLNFSVILGRDCSGVIVDVGSNVTKFEVGDEVWLSIPYWMSGTFMEFISVRENYVSHKPERLDFLEAASLPYSSCIALDCVKRRAGIFDVRSGKGKKVLVHCGNTATGCIIIQLCSMYNVNITTSCVSQAVNKMIDAGAQSILLLDQMSPDVPSCRKFDIVFNTIGESAQQFCINHVGKGGMIINASGGHYVPLGTHGFFYSRMYVLWVKLLRKLGYMVWKDVPMNSCILDEISELVNEGKLYPAIDSVFDAKFCERAFWFLQTSQMVGKPVILFK